MTRLTAKMAEPGSKAGGRTHRTNSTNRGAPQFPIYTALVSPLVSYLPRAPALAYIDARPIAYANFRFVHETPPASRARAHYARHTAHTAKELCFIKWQLRPAIARRAAREPGWWAWMRVPSGAKNLCGWGGARLSASY